MKSLSLEDLKTLELLASEYASVAHQTDEASMQVKMSLDRDIKVFFNKLNHSDVPVELEFFRQIFLSFVVQIQNNKRPSIQKEQDERLRRKDIQDEQTRNHLQMKKDSTIDGTRAIFHRIEPGSFIRGRDNKPIVLTQPIFLMATATTQIIYRKIAELANKTFPDRYHIVVDPSQYKGETLPVESVSLREVKLWVKALNALSRAKDITVQKALNEIIVGHVRGMKYKGFSTDAQREFVMQKSRTRPESWGEFIDILIQQNNMPELREHIFFGFSGAGPAPVTSLMPVFVDGKPFYGLNGGHIYEWVEDRQMSGNDDLACGLGVVFMPEVFPSGTDPVGKKGKFQKLRGGIFHLPNYFHSSFDSRTDNLGGSSTIGFRMTREPTQEEKL